MRIQHNIMAMNAYRNYNTNTSALSKNLEKLSSGYKINRAGDDAAGLAISEKMRAQITGLEAAQKNVKDGISLVNTAEGAMQEVQNMLNRMVYLAQESANGTMDNEVDRKALQAEIDQLNSEIDRIADSANFNGIKLLDGSLGMNTNAFKVESSAANEASAVSGLFGTLPASGSTKVTNTIVHTDTVEGQIGEFTIDFSQVYKEADGQAGSKATVTVSIGGQAVDVEAADSTSALTATGIVTKLVTEASNVIVKNDGTIAIASAGGLAAVLAAAGTGAIVYEASDAGNGQIKFTAKKYVDSTGAAQAIATSGDMANVAATAANVDLNMDVTVTNKTGGTAGAGALSGTESVGTKATNSAKQELGKLAHTTIDFDITKLEDGMEITLGDGTYKVALGADSAYKNETNKIDLTKYTAADLTDSTKKADIINAVVNGLNNGNGYFFVGQTANNKITLSEIGDASTGVSSLSTDKQAELTSVDKISSLLSAKKPAANATTTIDITAGSIGEGDILTIDGKKYVFTDDVAGAATKYGSGVTAVDKKNAVADLNTKLGAANLTTSVSGNKITITAAAGADPVEVMGKGLNLQIGDTSDSYNQLSVLIGDIHANKLGVGSINIGTQAGGQAAVDVIKNAINQISSIRGTLGATSNRLDHTANNLSVMRENIQDAESSIRDTDIAEEMMSYTKNNILVQSAQAMLAQANQVPQGVLQLLQ